MAYEQSGMGMGMNTVWPGDRVEWEWTSPHCVPCSMASVRRSMIPSYLLSMNSDAARTNGSFEKLSSDW